jgi:L-threonylcarbamoyladenylate synthase
MRLTVEQAAERLKAGEVVAIPTDTVYGLAAPLHGDGAVQRIYDLKSRAADKGLLILVSNVTMILPMLDAHPEGFKLFAEKFWPGGLTLVMEVRTDKVPDKVRAGKKTAGFRVPSHPLTKALIDIVGPIACPSANISDGHPATSADQVELAFGDDFPVLDGGDCRLGVPSTIMARVDPDWRILRPGAVSRRDIELVARMGQIRSNIR